MIRILLVDDDPDILDGLQLQLRAVRDRWLPRFALGGAAAIELLDLETFDAVVSDLRMPGIDGLQVLAHASARHPEAARLVLSGVMSPPEIAREPGLVHRVLAKPCPPQRLRDAVEKAIRVVRHLEEPASVRS